MFDEYFYSEFEVATVKRHPVRSECRNFGRVLRGWPWKCLEEGQVTSLVNVATVKRHPVRSECRTLWGQIIHPLSVGSFRSSLVGFLWGICENVSNFRGCLAISKYFPIFSSLTLCFWEIKSPDRCNGDLGTFAFWNFVAIRTPFSPFSWIF